VFFFILLLNFSLPYCLGMWFIWPLCDLNMHCYMWLIAYILYLMRLANGIMKENSKYWKSIIRGETHKGMTVNETCHTKSGHVMKKCIICLVASTSISVHYCKVHKMDQNKILPREWPPLRVPAWSEPDEPERFSREEYLSFVKDPLNGRGCGIGYQKHFWHKILSCFK
jgi:hypothetical protein